MEITITLNAAPEVVDPGDSTGLTADAHAALMDALMEFGDVVSVEGRAVR